MTITHSQLKEIENFHKKIKKETKLKLSRCEKLLKKFRNQAKAGKNKRGGMRNNDGQGQEAINHVNDQISQYNPDGNTEDTGGMVVNPNSRVGMTGMLALFSRDSSIRERATNALLTPMENEERADNVIRYLLAGMVIVPTTMTYYLFQPLRNITRNFATYPDTPSSENTFCDNLPDFLCRTGPTSIWNRIINFGSQSLYTFMYCVAFVGDLFDRLLALGVVGVTVAVGFTLLITAIMIWRTHRNGGAVWFCCFRLDNRRSAESSRSNRIDRQTLTNPSRGRIRERQSLALRDLGPMIPPMNAQPRRRAKSATRKGMTKRQKDKLKKKAQKGKRIGDPSLRDFKFDNNKPDKGGPGVSTGGRRKKRKYKKRRKTRRSSKKKRRKKTRKRRRN
jgi:hypothetical protein